MRRISFSPRIRAIYGSIASERNFVVHVVALAACAGRRHRRLALARGCWPGGPEIAVIGPCTATTTARAVEHGQRGIEPLQHHLGRIAVLSVFILPFARLKSAFEVNLRAFLEILLGDLGKAFAEDNNTMPFGFLAPLAGALVAPGFRRRVRRTSGSAPRLPTRITLLTLPAMMLSAWRLTLVASPEAAAVRRLRAACRARPLKTKLHPRPRQRSDIGGGQRVQP